MSFPLANISDEKQFMLESCSCQSHVFNFHSFSHTVCLAENGKFSSHISGCVYVFACLIWRFYSTSNSNCYSKIECLLLQSIAHYADAAPGLFIK